MVGWCQNTFYSSIPRLAHRGHEHNLLGKTSTILIRYINLIMVV